MPILPTPSPIIDDFNRDIWCILGIPIDNISLIDAVHRVKTSAKKGVRLSFVTPNLNWLIRATKDPQTRQQLLNADLSLADGAPIVALAKLLDTPIRERVAGSTLFETLCQAPSQNHHLTGTPKDPRPIRVFFFGGREGAAKAAHETLHRQSPYGCISVGWHNPGYGTVEEMSTPGILETINQAQADFIVVALGAAKGQDWIEHNQKKLGAPVIAHLGAVVDFTAGGIKRAPTSWQNNGLEWVWRIRQDPALWSRYGGDALSLIPLMVKRVLPQLQYAHSSFPKDKQPPSNEVRIEQDGPYRVNEIIELNGTLSGQRLLPVRQTFAKAIMGNRQGSLILDFQHVHHMDRAFLGLVLLLEKHLSQQKRSLKVRALTRQQEKLFRVNMMYYEHISP